MPNAQAQSALAQSGSRRRVDTAAARACIAALADDDVQFSGSLTVEVWSCWRRSAEVEMPCVGASTKRVFERPKMSNARPNSGHSYTHTDFDTRTRDVCV